MNPSGDIRLHSVLVATDFSAASEKAVRHAVAIARYFEAKPYAIHVTRSYRDVSISDLQYGNVLERELESCNGQFAFREGDVWVELQKFIRQRQIELVVIGTHGRTGLKKLVLGSVAENVFRHVSCPVVTVGPNSPSTFESRPKAPVTLCSPPLLCLMGTEDGAGVPTIPRMGTPDVRINTPVTIFPRSW